MLYKSGGAKTKHKIKANNDIINIIIYYCLRYSKKRKMMRSENQTEQNKETDYFGQSVRMRKIAHLTRGFYNINYPYLFISLFDEDFSESHKTWFA